MTIADIDKPVLKKVAVRLLPMLMILYFLSYVDRVNVGFAALTMNVDLGLSATAYGLGAGVFFIGYFLFEVPSQFMLDKFGARIWITRIVVTWGAIAAASLSTVRARPNGSTKPPLFGGKPQLPPKTPQWTQPTTGTRSARLSAPVSSCWDSSTSALHTVSMP